MLINVTLLYDLPHTICGPESIQGLGAKMLVRQWYARDLCQGMDRHRSGRGWLSIVVISLYYVRRNAGELASHARPHMTGRAEAGEP